MTSDLDLKDRELLNIIQSSFPLVEEPFQHMGETLGLDESDVIQRIERMKAKNVVRQISAIFDTRRLGYKTMLVAMKTAPEEQDAAAQVINRHPGVSHNYARNSHYNLWFTLAVPPGGSLEDTVAQMADETGADSYRLMPTIRFFKIGVNFDMVKGEGASTKYYSPDGFDKKKERPKTDEDAWKRAQALTDFEIDAVRELQEDVTLEPRPFSEMAQRLGTSERELFDLAASFQDRGIMRRFSAVLHHRRAGFHSNGMAVWVVPPERSTEVGNIMAQSRWVTHCYERPTFPDWPYTHFTMLHAMSKEGCEAIAQEISQQTGITDYQVLYSYREYKKTRVRYFV
ncbi:MAG: AsnC family transcriptional regulator [SAR202 cluster bacterium]|nr:AsnC family transcriptional regulator [SAR202 cluster bacterium]